MTQFLVPLVSGVGGTLIGCLLTWHLMTRTVRNEARRKVLVMAAEALQDYRVAYAQWYAEYLSPEAQAVEDWAKPPTGKPDPVYLQLMSAVDTGRGRLRVINGALYAHFRKTDVKPLCTEMLRVLTMSAGDKPADCRKVDEIVEKAHDLIPDMIRRFF
ncbi:MAG: hypothetical protein JW889_03605 [Verrucomicrobia bacterium]|nr:hypothetical protein [Verrucomicrobiota bacterium]